MNFLANKNNHPRDERISFVESTHIYTIDDHDSSYTSVTTFVHQQFEEFNSDKIIDAMMKSPKWPKNQYYGLSKEEIKNRWKQNGKEAALLGTKLHYDIECYYNNCPKPNDTLEYGYFQNFLKRFGHLKPYRTEWMVFDEELKLSGSIDMVFEDDNGDLLIYDWKRCKEIKTTGFNKFSHNKLLEHLPDSNYWHYCLQLNIYKAILEKNYNKKVVGLFLVCLHPNNKNNNYLRMQVTDLNNEVSQLFQERKKLLQNT